MDLCCYRFSVLVNVVTQLAREDVVSELMYAGDFVFLSKTIERLRNK